ncbi:WXG100 family type VII secretion target [Kitasatospora sp. NPDC057965]|uniref:WXG100 family type VII secretion target n=1 Tax=Kitasatospora sp. NPDC057965 TaxID=3346291 RepID=UPI0036DAE1BC
MADLEFERRMNPWLFDSSGNLTAEAKKQFPDLAAAAAGAPPPVTLPPAAGGPSVKANPGMIRQAGTNATALRESVRTECAQPAGHVTGAVTALMGWNLSTALNTAWSVWSGQAHTLGEAVGTIGKNLHATAQNYDNTESAIHSQFAQQHG